APVTRVLGKRCAAYDIRSWYDKHNQSPGCRPQDTLASRHGGRDIVWRSGEGRVEYRDKVVVVTGASSGIRLGTAPAFAPRRAIVVGVARREERLQQLMRECQPLVPASSYLVGDLGTREFAERTIDSTVERYGRLDILVNNAAISKHKQIYHMSADEADYVMRV